VQEKNAHEWTEKMSVYAQ